MSDKQSRLYEGMFLVDANRASANEKAIEDYIKETITRSGGEIVAFEKWEEMKLAYTIKGHNRGVYYLVHFNAAPTQIENLRRTFHLSGQILRVLLLRDEDGTGSGKRILPDELESPSQRKRGPDADRTRNAIVKTDGDEDTSEDEDSSEDEDTSWDDDTSEDEDTSGDDDEGSELADESESEPVQAPGEAVP